MRASVINRFAKFTVPAVRLTDTSWVRRSAVTVPFAAVLATCAVACGPTGDPGRAPGTAAAGTPSAAVPGAGVPSTSAPAAPSTAAPVAPSTSAAPSSTPTAAAGAPAAPRTSAAPSTSAAPTATAAAPATATAPAPSAGSSGSSSSSPSAAPGPAAPSSGASGLPGPGVEAGQVSITTKGFEQGRVVRNDGVTVPFSVTFTNTGGTAVAQLVPRVELDRAPVGTLEEQLDDGGWLRVPLSAADPGTWEFSPAFALAPGACRTVNYRISFAPQTMANIAWTLHESAMARVAEGGYADLGDVAVPLPTAPASTLP